MKVPAEKSKQQAQSTQSKSGAKPVLADNRADMAQLKANQAIMEGSSRQQHLQALQAQMEAGAQLPQKANNTGLPDRLKSGVESLSGMSMDHVRVHYNSDRPGQLQAHAYAQGSDIHVAPGQEKHLPHEAWHVVQQAQGRVKPTVQMKGNVPVNDDAGLEAEADAMGAKALAQTVQSPAQLQRMPAAGESIVQREQFIGNKKKHHLHIEIRQDHYTFGTDDGARIEIGNNGNYRLDGLIEARNYLVDNGFTSNGGQECITWLENECTTHDDWDEERGYVPSYMKPAERISPHVSNIVELFSNLGVTQGDIAEAWEEVQGVVLERELPRHDDTAYYPEGTEEDEITDAVETYGLQRLLAGWGGFPVTEIFTPDDALEYFKRDAKEVLFDMLRDEFPLPSSDEKNYHTSEAAIAAHRTAL